MTDEGSLSGDSPDLVRRQTGRAMPAPLEDVVGIEIPAHLWSVVDSSLDNACQPVAGGVRADTAVAITTDARGRHHLVFTGLPAQVDPNTFLITVANRVNQGALSGVSDVRDDGPMRRPNDMQLRVSLKRGAEPDAVLAAVLLVLGDVQRDTGLLAAEIRAALRRRKSDTDGRTVIAQLTRSQWGFVGAELDRHDDQPDGRDIVSARRQAGDVIDTALFGERLDLEVARGRSQAGVQWQITLTGRVESALAMVTASYPGRHLGSGGLSLDDDRPASTMRVMTSYNVGLPTFVMVIVDGAVDRFVITTREGREQEIALSEPDITLGRRYGADDLLAGEDIGSMRTEGKGVTIEEKTSGSRRER